MEKESFLAKVLAGLVPEGVNLEFNPHSNTLLLSKLLDNNNGNANVLRIVMNKNEPEIKQRIYANDSRNNN